MYNQTTIQHPVSLTGIRITGEADAKVSFYPAPPNTGIVFIRRDLPGRPKIKCSLKKAKVEYRWTSLVHGNVRIEHTEHALAAISGLGLDNMFIELAQPSLPVMPDYSSKDFTQALLSAGLVQQPFKQKKIKIHKPIVVFKREKFGNAKNEKLIMALPYDGFKLTYVLDYPDLPQLSQYAEINITPETFAKELAEARSFIIESEVEEVVNLTGEASSNVLVVKSGSEQGEWLWPNELARHKTLDLLGDLSLLGERIIGHVIGIRSGHRLNLALCKKICRECKNDSFGETHGWYRGTNADE
ncbi:UDP-3-O-acyl-N-acetylglucosamine deacetylase [Anaerosolibacter carboniphilus]|uniref:UDP-3-O-acyl-N-acetylglucosamine deacetylase n=1 Tax=Anaerosolibacter carboniphilus TaxID=1417629 RepID=A0A841KTK2_9FIRM|nr:UDP-3-O-acyl-N-acetylglucosamine deacetylase [Anaerosolibacter carboniphilus]MBB6215360.1 UDP-3-O-acyl-N-acetylglucosamine deacetylase [Anaerosolibacter carboniphilus]